MWLHASLVSSTLQYIFGAALLESKPPEASRAPRKETFVERYCFGMITVTFILVAPSRTKCVFASSSSVKRTHQYMHRLKSRSKARS